MRATDDRNIDRAGSLNRTEVLGVASPVAVFLASGVVATLSLISTRVLTQAGLLGGPAWAVRLGPRIQLVVLAVGWVLTGTLYLAGAGLLATVWHEYLAWKALPAVATMIMVTLLFGAVVGEILGRIPRR